MASITGRPLVRVNQTNQVYCIEGGISYNSVAWTVPDGATFAETPEIALRSTLEQRRGLYKPLRNHPVKLVRCEFQSEYSHFTKGFALLGPGTNDQASLRVRQEVSMLSMVSSSMRATLTELYDHFQLVTTSILNPNQMSDGVKSFT